MSSELLKAKVQEIIRGLGQKDKSKEATRAILLERRSEVARNLSAGVKAQERRAINLMRRCRYPDVKPVLKRISSSDADLWTYMRVCLSSAPWTGRPGRLLRYLVVDEKTGGVLGVVDLGSEVMQLGPRDRLIGWKQYEKLGGGGLRRIVNMGTCVAAQPFGWLCGGKYIAEAVASREIAADWKRKYCDALALACTTSLYGKSSQYNRLANWIYLGNTPGASPHSMLCNRDKKILKTFVRQHGRISRAGGYGGDLGGMMDVLSKAVHYSGLPALIVGEGQPRGVYISELYSGAIGDLRTGLETSTPERTAQQAADWWRSRWCDMRWPKERDKITSFDWSQYQLKNVIRAGSIAGDAPANHAGQGGSIPTSALNPSVSGDPRR